LKAPPNSALETLVKEVWAAITDDVVCARNLRLEFSVADV